jgi:hypothetical protein
VTGEVILLPFVAFTLGGWSLIPMLCARGLGIGESDFLTHRRNCRNRTRNVKVNSSRNLESIRPANRARLVTISLSLTGAQGSGVQT